MQGETHVARPLRWLPRLTRRCANASPPSAEEEALQLAEAVYAAQVAADAAAEAPAAAAAAAAPATGTAEPSGDAAFAKGIEQLQRARTELEARCAPRVAWSRQRERVRCSLPRSAILRHAQFSG